MSNAARTLRYAAVAGTRPGRAALASFPRGKRDRLGPHAHADFHEVLLVTAGHGIHIVGGDAIPLRAGDMVLVRPHDEHDFAGTNEPLEFINVAFPSHRWHLFADLAGVSTAREWDRQARPPVSHDTGQPERKVFTAMLAGSARGLRPLEIIQLWSTVLPLLERITGHRPDSRPAWLGAACDAMTEEENLRAGLPRLLELAAVSHGHLARSMAAHYGCTPVEFLTSSRLERAAALLTTTTAPVGVIADRCGFTSQSYFGRLFRQRYGCAPRAYREADRRVLVPGS